MQRNLLFGIFLVTPALMAALAQVPVSNGQGKASQESVSFCTLATHSKDYNGRIVVTEAAAGYGFHALVLFDPLCSDEKLPSGSHLSAHPTFHPPYMRETPLDKKLTALLAKQGIVRIIFIGRVDSTRDAYGPEGDPFEVNVQSLISVYEIPAAEQKFFGIAKGKGPK